MEALPHLRVTLELDPHSEPIQGRLRLGPAHDDDAAARPFRGWLELAALIEGIRAVPEPDRRPAE